MATNNNQSAIGLMTNNSGIVNKSNKDLGIIQMDFLLTSTLASNLQIEMFNPESSQMYQVNTDINNYYPGLGSTLIDAGTTLKSSAANGYGVGVVTGIVDFYVNANAVTPAAGTDTKNICYFDVNGTAVYQPGYLNGALPAGNVTIQCTTGTTSYRQFFDWCNNHVWNFISQKANYSESGQQSSVFTVTTRTILGDTAKTVITPLSYKTEDQYNPLIITMPIEQKMRANRGIRYIMQAPTGGNASQTVSLNCFISPDFGK